jgi:phosphomannomutase/phosphoglucomutase
MYGAARFLRIVADSDKSVSGLLADVPKFVSTPELRIDCPDEIKFSLVDKAVRYFRSKYDVVDVDGVRVLFGDGWGLIRASNTQPVIVCRYEARTSERLQAIRDEMEAWLREQGVRT